MPHLLTPVRRKGANSKGSADVISVAETACALVRLFGPELSVSSFLSLYSPKQLTVRHRNQRKKETGRFLFAAQSYKSYL